MAILDTIDALKLVLVGDAKTDRLILRKGRQNYGYGLGKLSDLLSIAFSSSTDDFRERVGRCYKVYVEFEKENPNYVVKRGPKRKAVGWITASAIAIKDELRTKIFSFWCFSASFG